MEVYSRISAMEPLLPTQRRAELSSLSAELLRKIGRLSGQVHSPVVRGKLAVLLRWMNCYYSNLIEGYKPSLDARRLSAVASSSWDWRKG